MTRRILTAAAALALLAGVARLVANQPPICVGISACKETPHV